MAMTNAQRQRLYRRRTREGLGVFRVRIERERFKAALIARGHLTEQAAQNREQLEAAISLIVDGWLRE